MAMHTKLLILVCMALAGCSTRETAESTMYADTSAKAIVKVLTAEAVVAELSATEQEAIVAAIAKAIKLASSISVSLHPAIVELSGSDRIETPSVEEAIVSTDSYIIKATMQAGKAEAEVESNNVYRGLISFAVQAAGSGALAWLSGGLLGSGALGLLFARGLKLYNTAKLAIDDQVAYTKDITNITEQDPALRQKRIHSIQETHAALQRRNGTHQDIAKALAKRKAKNA